jgi:hypothetical protein
VPNPDAHRSSAVRVGLYVRLPHLLDQRLSHDKNLNADNRLSRRVAACRQPVTGRVGRYGEMH